MTDSTPVRRFNWNEEIREYEDADGDECTYKTVVPASDFDRLQAENVRLAAQAADWSKHPEAQATIGGRARLSIELSIVNDLLAGETDISPMMVEYWHETHDKLQALIAERDSLRAQLAERDERIKRLEEESERRRGMYCDQLDYSVQLQRLIEAYCRGSQLPYPDLHHSKMLASQIQSAKGEANE